jgi:hypothetical protein
MIGSMPKSAAPGRGSRTGLVPRSTIVTALIITLRSVLIGLMLLSLMGTFYALIDTTAPFPQVWQMVPDMVQDSGTFLMALGMQLLFSLVQWGSATLAKEDRRWWFLYLLALAPSAWMNIQSYAEPTLQVFGWSGDRFIIVALLIIAFDIAPEKALQR